MKKAQLSATFKSVVHERWYTTKHENMILPTPLHPYTPTPFTNFCFPHNFLTLFFYPKSKAKLPVPLKVRLTLGWGMWVKMGVK